MTYYIHLLDHENIEHNMLSFNENQYKSFLKNKQFYFEYCHSCKAWIRVCNEKEKYKEVEIIEIE